MYVYIIKQGEFYKIGRTHNLEARRAALQCATPTKIELIAFVETDEQCLLEKKLHNELSQYHSSGEWFKFETSVLEELIENYGFKAYEKSKRSKSDIHLINRLSNSIEELENENRKLKSEKLDNSNLKNQLSKANSMLIDAKREIERMSELSDYRFSVFNSTISAAHNTIDKHRKFKANVLLCGVFISFLGVIILLKYSEGLLQLLALILIGTISTFLVLFFILSDFKNTKEEMKIRNTASN